MQDNKSGGNSQAENDDQDEGFDLGPDSALDLTMRGSTGAFKIASGNKDRSLEVKYLLTHISLENPVGQDDKILSKLAPVREIFDFKQLDFNEIMQRDIDDARVSSELIPYILDEDSRDLIKFFPPIVVFVLPVNESLNTPLKLYPKLYRYISNKKEKGASQWQITRSGPIGGEVFEFSQPMAGEKVLNHDLVSLKLNTSKSRMVIVDGQHRAMALLALHRNLKSDWNDANRKPFENYYSQWTKSHIQKFDLSGINLPMIICTVPELCEGFTGDYDIKRASRSIFLTLNKNARAVSRSRNMLLDDNDLISSFMRKILSEIKNIEENSETALRIHNIELDQEGDRMKVSNPIAISGVSHIYYIVEHLILNKSDDVFSIAPRKGAFWKRTKLQDANHRLGITDLIGADEFEKTERDHFSSNVESLLSGKFLKVFGIFIIKTFQNLDIFDIHNKCVLKLNEKLESNEDRQLQPMLFAGQGIQRVFDRHLENIKKDHKESSKSNPRMDVLISGLESTSERLSNSVDDFKLTRSQEWLKKISNSPKLKTDGEYSVKLIGLIRDIYDNVFSTIAFQSALVCTFFNEIEDLLALKKVVLSDSDLHKMFDEYMSQLNKFFSPDTYYKFRSFMSVMIGDVDESEEGLKFKERTPLTFRNIVFPGEMQPDQWTKYRYLILEIWTPDDSTLGSVVSENREICRMDVAFTLYNRHKSERAKSDQKLVEELTAEERKEEASKSFAAYSQFLGFFERKTEINKAGFMRMIKSHAGDEFSEGDGGGFDDQD